jgi:asparagine synthase (glutamine-hydrolysing)
MCGIAGIVGPDERDRSTSMRSMRDQLIHRGPDSSGELVDGYAALGVRRLKVIDLVTGDQPLSNETRDVWTVFNGEIYNFRELRTELRARGHTFRTQSDTEVIPHLYEDHGAGFAERLQGMFAVAVWDQRSRTLVLARDRLGKKPLLYAEAGGTLAFASEHKALLAGVAPGTVDAAAIRLYLDLGYVPAPLDAFRGFRKLPAGHTLTWTDGRTELHRYWRLPEPGTLRIGEAEAIAELRRLLTAAVERRLVADVPIGAFLSGGVDSSAVVATMANLQAQVRTFTIAFNEASHSEAKHAREVARLFATEHHEFTVEPHASDVLPLLVEHYGEPYADSSALPTYYLARLTREHVTVALNGDGGDEAFAGYERYAAMGLASAFDRLPDPARGRFFGTAANVIPASLRSGGPLRKAHAFLAIAGLRRAERYERWIGPFGRTPVAGLLSPEFGGATDADVTRFWAGGFGAGEDVIAQAEAHDYLHYLPDDLLVKMDIASMANSLEVRSPFLDTDLVEFAIQLPTSLKMRRGSGKLVLKRAFAGVLPDTILYRRKQGFAPPISAWLRRELRPMVEDLVLSPQALGRGYFAPEPLERYVRAHIQGSADHGYGLWTLLMLELWHRWITDLGSTAPRAVEAQGLAWSP